jgi:hypothetical protein
VRGEVHQRIADHERLGGLIRGPLGASEDRAHARDELAHAERLRHVVVGARVEPADLVDLLERAVSIKMGTNASQRVAALRRP